MTQNFKDDWRGYFKTAYLLTLPPTLPPYLATNFWNATDNHASVFDNLSDLISKIIWIDDEIVQRNAFDWFFSRTFALAAFIILLWIAWSLWHIVLTAVIFVLEKAFVNVLE